MTNGTLAIYDSDIDYLHHLSEYLRARDDFPYDIITFNDMDAMYEYSQKSIDILITSTIPEFKTEIGDTFYLSTEPISTYEGFVCIYKYQPADMMVRTLMEHCKYQPYTLSQGSKASIIGIYSPVNRCGKTTLALSLGYALSSDSSTLLLSFDSYSFLYDFVNSASLRDISDLLFYYTDEPDNLRNKLLTLSYKFYELNFLCPPASPQRIKDITSNLWCELIDKISRLGLYKYIVLDISNLFSDLESLFNLCDSIFVPYIDDYPSSVKIDSFFECMSYTSDLDKEFFQMVKLPQPPELLNKSAYINWVTGGELISLSKELMEVSHVSSIC